MKVGKQEVAGESPRGNKASGVLPCPAVTAWDPALRLTSLRNRDGESQVDVSDPHNCMAPSVLIPRPVGQAGRDRKLSKMHGAEAWVLHAR